MDTYTIWFVYFDLLSGILSKNPQIFFFFFFFLTHKKIPFFHSFVD